MVLEEASATAAPDAFRDDASPGSDFDAYATPTGSATSSSSTATPPGYVLDMNKLPKPIPIFGALFGITTQVRRDATLGAFASMSAIVQRPLTKDECDSIAYHLNKGAAISSWGQPLGATAAYYRYHKTRAEFRFPFWKPSDTLDRNKLFFLQGARARVAWDFLRLGSYGVVGGWAGKLIAGAYAATIATVGQKTDVRMKDILEAIQSVGGEEAGRRARSTPDWDRRRGGQRGGKAPEPAPQEDYGGILAEGDVQRDFDDASPTAGNAPVDTAPASPSSAWDRVRGGGQSPQTGTRTAPGQKPSSGNAWANLRGNNLQSQPRDSQPSRDSYSFSSSDEDGQLAKAEAQRDFDAKLERERKGEDFEETKRWR